MSYIAIKGFPKDDETVGEIERNRDKMLICGGKWAK